MFSSKTFRSAGFSALAGGVLWIVLAVAYSILLSGRPESVAALTGTWAIVVGSELIAAVLTLLGLTGLYARQAGETATPGFIAFVVALAGTTMMAGLSWANMFATPALAAEAPQVVDAMQATRPQMLMIGYGLSMILFSLGWLLFGLVSWRGGVFPRGASLLLMLGALLVFLLFLALQLPLGLVPFGAALVWLGYVVWADAGEQVPLAQAAPSA